MNQQATTNEGSVMKRIKVKEAMRIYWDVHAAQKKSFKSYKVSISHINDVIGDKYIDQVSRLDIVMYRNMREKKSKASTVNREHTVLIHMFNLLKELNRNKTISVLLPEDNPGSLVRKANERPFCRKRVLTPAEYAQFENYLQDEAKDICRMAVLTTLRKKDLQCLNRDNINTSTNQLEGVQAKTGKPYAIPITPQIQSILNKHKSHKILNFTNFRRQFEIARGKCQLQHFRFADLRRSGARTMLLNGIDIKTVSEYLGHSDLRMTQVYVPPCSLDFQRAATTLTQAYNIA